MTRYQHTRAGRRRERRAEVGASAVTSRNRRDGTVDESVRQCGREKSERMALGIAALHDVAVPGVRYALDEIAVWAGCTNAAIQLIELRAMQRIRKALYLRGDTLLTELLEGRKA